ncbi:MAG: efflux RND transporter periplasmic adaptor subunit [Candidatus Omnitrophota bacterium]
MLKPKEFLKNIFSKVKLPGKIQLSKPPDLKAGISNIKQYARNPKIAVGAILAVVIITIIGFQVKSRIITAKTAQEPEGMTLSMGAGEEIPQEPILVKVYKVQKRDFEDNLPILGTIKGFKEINLKFESSGMVDSFNFREGERVEEGEIIATINQKDALLKLKYNEIEYRKHKTLYEIGAITKTKVDQVRLELESAKRELDKTYLYAPRNGVLGTKDVEVGEVVSYTDQIATLIDDSEVLVEVGVIEKDIGKVRVGQRATVVVDTYPDKKFEGHVDNISPVIEGKARTQTAKIKVKNEETFLMPGMFARSIIAVYAKEGAIVIPNGALDKTEDGYITYVVQKTEAQEAEAEEGAADEKTEDEKASEDKEKQMESLLDQLGEQMSDDSGGVGQAIEEEGVVEGRIIKADYRSAEFFVVKSGLEEGDLVVVETQEKLKDQYKVIITEVQEAIF